MTSPGRGARTLQLGEAVELGRVGALVGDMITRDRRSCRAEDVGQRLPRTEGVEEHNERFE